MMRRSIALAALLLLVTAVAAFGQAQKGTITVTVEADDGARLPGATVSAESDQTLSRRTAVTGADGVAVLPGMDPAVNYVVTTTLDGFTSARNENVAVRAGQTTPLRVSLSVGAVTEEVVVTAESPVVDITSAQTGQDITLDLTEALPTARSYQDYLQLVPGVQAAIIGNNPASRSGINYTDVLGRVGTSSDNFYYFDGINVTDPLRGTFGANLNTEIIQEQSVRTGGIPAEFVGATGLVSNVVTKSGGNEFSGSVNYYFQDDSLVADNENRADATFSTYDTAVTFGGPIVRDKAWFFASYRNVNREDDVVSPDPAIGVLRTVESDADQAFGKITWSITDGDLLSGTFLSDPQDLSGSSAVTRSNARNFAREQGGERYTLNYSKVFGAAVLDAAITDHEGDLNDSPTVPGPSNTVSFRSGDPFTQAEQQLGGFGNILLETTSTESQKASLEYLVDSSWGSHTLKGGFELGETAFFEDALRVDNQSLTSISARYLGTGIRAGELEAGGFSSAAFTVNSNADFGGLINTINAHPNRAFFYGLLDTNSDGTITQAEARNSLVYNSTAGNPNGQINYNRSFQVQDGPKTVGSESTVWFLQDNWQWNKWSINLGVRAEEWEHFASTGEDIYTFDFEYAPRFSVAYDLKGDGKHRLTAYYGRYYDPIRNNMTDFAGSLTGAITEEQVFVGNEWLTYRTRGGPVQQDGFFALTTETPYTDEYQIGYKVDLGGNQSFEVNLIKRETRDILEDFAPTVYLTGEDYPGPINHPDSLFLGLEYFGFTPATFPNANFIIGTLPGGERNWEGLELIYRKRLSNNWQVLSSYNYADADGNSNSDSNADFAGDFIEFDPRAPNVFGTQAGLVEHLFKVHATYSFDNGIQLGGAYRWNSGVVVNRTAQLFSRNNPIQVEDPFVFAGILANWVAPGAVGTLENPSYGIFDLRVAYLWNINDRFDADFFVDIFNVLDEQEATQIQDLISGGSGFAFQEGILFNDPRRFFLGARLRF